MRASSIILVTLLLAAPGMSRGSPAAQMAANDPVRVAVLYFDYEGKDDELAALRKGLAAMLISDLSDIDGVQLVERGDLEKVLAELELQKSRYFDKGSTARVGKGLGAELLVTGRIVEFRGKLLVNAKVVEVERGVVTGVRSARPVDEFLSLEQELATLLRKSLVEGAVSGRKLAPAKRQRKGISPSKKRKRLSPPKKLKGSTAARYGTALDAADRGDFKRARRLLADVLREQPGFELAKADLIGLAR